MKYFVQGIYTVNIWIPGMKKDALPACAYDAIRRKFRDEQEFMGYEDDK